MKNIKEKKEDIIRIKHLLLNSISDDKWKRELRWFFNEIQIENIIDYLNDQYENNIKWCPKPENIFDAFKYDNYDNLKVVLIGMEPSSVYTISRGLSFSISDQYKSKSRFYTEFLKAIKKINPNKESISFDDWSKQGVLLLNLGLTSTYTKRYKYIDLWKPFREYLYDNLKDKDLIYVFVGKDSWKYSNEIESDYIIRVTHPSYLKYEKSKWSDSDLFIKINNMLKSKKENEIIW